MAELSNNHSPSQRLAFHRADAQGVEYGHSRSSAKPYEGLVPEKFATSCLFKMQNSSFPFCSKKTRCG